MMLRKPLIGDVIETMSNFFDHDCKGAPPEWAILGTVVEVNDDNICYVETGGPEPDCFIWRFKDNGSSNKVHRIKEQHD